MSCCAMTDLCRLAWSWSCPKTRRRTMRLRLVTFIGLSVLSLAPAAWAASATTDPVVQLPRFEVRERKGICEFGLSVVTNVGVVFGGKIKWMRVGDVLPGSAAALAGLQTQDEIASIDGSPLTE